MIARQTRSAMLEVLDEDYVRTARAKGLPPSRVIGLHALRNALIPVVTMIGLQVEGRCSAARFSPRRSSPGRASANGSSIRSAGATTRRSGRRDVDRDIVMFVNLVVDLLYGLIDPRIRHGR